MSHRENYADNDGVRIRYLTNDPVVAVGPLPVVFVPGITDFADDYIEMFKVVHDRKLLVVEMRGRGGSDAPQRGYSPAEQATDVVAAVEAEQLGRYHLMSFSRGTTPAIEVALADPRRVVTLAIGDYRAVEIALPAGFVDQQWTSRWRGRPIRDRVRRHVLEAIQSESRPREFWDDIAALGIPIMVARGDAPGGLVTDEAIQTYRERIRDVEVFVAKGSGHDLFRPDRGAYPRAVIEFIHRRAPGL